MFFQSSAVQIYINSQRTNAMNIQSKRSQRLIVNRLLQDFRDDCRPSVEQQWLRLAAAHVVGQNDLSLHLQVHSTMLGFAVRTRDWAEAVGQLVRLALVPVGHLLDRLPAGNIGRATVSAFKPMPVPPEVMELIVQARCPTLAHGVESTPGLLHR